MSLIIDNTLDRLNQVVDYVPVISTLHSMVSLYYKYVVIPSCSEEDLKGNHYFKNLQEKSTYHYLTALVPVLGNVLLLIYDIYLFLIEENQKIPSIHATLATVGNINIPILLDEEVDALDIKEFLTDDLQWDKFICAMAKTTLPKFYPDGKNLRYGHDFTHAARVEILAKTLLEMQEKTADSQDKFNVEEKRALSLACFLQRSGRTKEDKEYLCPKRSAEIFEYYAKKLNFSQTTVENFKRGIQHMDEKTPLEDCKAEKARLLISTAHKFDLVRCYKLDRDIVFSTLEPLLGNTNGKIAYPKLVEYACLLAQATHRWVTHKKDRPKRTPFHHLTDQSKGINLGLNCELCLTTVRAVSKNIFD